MTADANSASGGTERVTLPVPQPKFLPVGKIYEPQVQESRTDPAGTLTAVASRNVKQVLVIRKDLHMRRGKEIAQGAHASMAWLSRRLVHSESSAVATFSDAEKQWLMTSFRKVTLQVSSEKELLDVFDKAEAAGLEVHLITDSGLTEFAGTQTATAVGVGPDFDDRIDPVTLGLSLY